MTPRQLTYARIAFAVYLVAVLVLCFGNFPSSEEVPKELWGIPMDKVVHFLMFFPFPLLAFLALDRYQGKRWHGITWSGVTLAAGALFAAFTELVQSRLPYRTGDPADFQADALALLAGTAIVLIVILLKQKK